MQETMNSNKKMNATDILKTSFIVLYNIIVYAGIGTSADPYRIAI